MVKDEELIAAGVTMVKKYGALFPVDELCAMINISKKTFYAHFQTKNHFMEKIITSLMHKWKHEADLHSDFKH